MRIALDARTVYWPIRRGTGRNLIDLYTHLVRLRSDWQVLAYHRLSGPTPALLPWPEVQPRLIEMPGDRLDAWRHLRLPMAAWSEHADLLHCPANLCPLWMPLPTVVTIHDLIPLDMPQFLLPQQVKRFERSVRHACRHAVRIVTPSQYTRNRLVEQFGADSDRITVNAWAPDSSMRVVNAMQVESVMERYGIMPPFVLHLGAAAPRKNTQRVIDAWAQLGPRGRREWQLLVIGLDDMTKQNLEQRVDLLGIRQSTVLHGFVPEEDMPALHTGADVLAYPSLSEGFGLPILDAWATQTAVLTSDTTSLPEVAGDAALLVDPLDTGAIVAGLARLIRDRTLRADLIHRGQTRLPAYNWNATTQRFADAMEQASSHALHLRRDAA
ncbi:MAG: glycosyltransferase family 4 protein [Phycisphaeraceae bacterium]|nr:glycosyltransferase family 4 protein [Phycisphaeraceae bacterium]